jgi:hypothetical protein
MSYIIVLLTESKGLFFESSSRNFWTLDQKKMMKVMLCLRRLFFQSNNYLLHFDDIFLSCVFVWNSFLHRWFIHCERERKREREREREREKSKANHKRRRFDISDSLPDSTTIFHHFLKFSRSKNSIWNNLMESSLNPKIIQTENVPKKNDDDWLFYIDFPCQSSKSSFRESSSSMWCYMILSEHHHKQ